MVKYIDHILGPFYYNIYSSCYDLKLGSDCNSDKDLSKNKGYNQLVKYKDIGMLLRSQKVDLAFFIFLFSYSHFHFLFDLFLKLRVRSHDPWKDIEGSRRSDVIQHVNCMLTSCLTHGTLE